MRSFLFACVAAAVVFTRPVPASACGGCFHPPPQPNESESVITDHRMALSVSTTQTVLWDQIRYSGDPKEFAWVLPVGQGAYVELARDEWLSALDALTAPTVFAPPLPSRCYATTPNNGGGSLGCGASANSADYGGADGGVAEKGVDSGVNVISQSVVGPYATVTIRSSSGEAITQWLTTNGYDIPASVQPILDAYTNEGFDFIALKLAPNAGVAAMQPVRVITPGADPTIPLRMVAAGIGSTVGLTLFVISEGRYDAANFTNATIDPTAVVWDPIASQSNYSTLFDSAVAAGDTWVTEYAGGAKNLDSLYQQKCAYLPQVPVTCDASDASAGDAASDASSSDAAITDASVDDASDASDADASCVSYESACTEFTDYTTATTGLDAYGVYVTRLRTVLPAKALGVDLKLAANAEQTTVSNTIQTTQYSTPDYDPCPNAPQQKTGSGCATVSDRGELVPIGLAIIALASVARRKRR